MEKIDLTQREKNILTIFVNKCVQARSNGHPSVCWNEVRGMFCVKRPTIFLFEGMEKKEIDPTRRAFKSIVKKGLIEIEKKDKLNLAYISPDVLSRIKITLIQRNPSTKKGRELKSLMGGDMEGKITDKAFPKENDILEVIESLRKEVTQRKEEIDGLNRDIEVLQGLRKGFEVFKRYKVKSNT